MRPPGSLWCTTALRVDLVRGDDTQPMLREGDWWLPETPLVHGERYAFRLDGGEALPDPRSPDQPDGVFAASRHDDPSRFDWTDEGFCAAPLDAAVLYELHVGCFTPEGTFEAAIQRLDEVAALGVTHVEVMPVAAFPGARGWGYDGVALFAPFAGYGGPEGFRRFVDACHGLGLGVILDVVYNHLGPEGNHLARFAPYFSWRHRTPWGAAFNLDEAHADEVRAFLCDNAAHWVRDYHCDGVRLDATHALHDASAVHVLTAIRDAATEAGRGRRIAPLLIAEHLENDPRITSTKAHGLALDGQWCDDFHHAVHAWLTGERRGGLADFGSIEEVARCLERGWHLDGRPSRYRGRSVGRRWDGQPLHRLIGYVQNHDQVGNRARGERLASLVSEGRAKIAAALLLLGPTTPMLFMGEERGETTPFLFFADFADPRLRRDVERGRRRELEERGYRDPPSPGAASTFEASMLDWAGERPPIWAWYRSLITLRREHPELYDGESPRVVHGGHWLAMQRGAIVVAVNVGPPVAVPVAGEILLGEVEETLPTDGVAVWEGSLTG